MVATSAWESFDRAMMGIMRTAHRANHPARLIAYLLIQHEFAGRCFNWLDVLVGREQILYRRAIHQSRLAGKAQRCHRDSKMRGVRARGHYEGLSAAGLEAVDEPASGPGSALS